MKLAFIELNSIKVQRKHVAICTSVILSSFSRLLIKWKLVLAILVDVSRGLINFIQSALDTRRSEMFFSRDHLARSISVYPHGGPEIFHRGLGFSASTTATRQR